MAAPVQPLPLVKLPTGPSPVSNEQRYWRTFKHQLLIPSVTSSPVTHISCPTFLGPPIPSLSTSAATRSGQHDSFAVTSGARVHIYSIRSRKLEKTISRFGDNARSAEIRRDGRCLVAGEDSGRIQVFDMDSRAILRTWTAHKQPVWRTVFSPADHTTVLSASDDRTVRLWDLPSNDPVTTFVGHTDYVRCANFMPVRGGRGAAVSSNLIVSGSYDATVRLRDARQGSAAPAATFY